jgi:hypothetical protein
VRPLAFEVSIAEWGKIDNLDETAVGIMQAIEKAIGGCEFAFVALEVGIAIAQR